jgi:LysM domain
MPSLSAHLRLPEDHSRLPFHPSCPVCRRDRLAGSLDGEELVSRRTQAAIAAGVLAFSTIGVPAAVASVPDEVTEGTAEVVDGGDPTLSDDFELGGEILQLPDEAPATPDVAAPPPGGDDDLGPLEAEPATEDVDAVVEPTDDAAAAPPAVVTPEPVTTPAADGPPVAMVPDEGDREDDADAGPVAIGGQRREAPEAVARTAPRSEPPVAAAPAAPPSVPEPVVASEPSVNAAVAAPSPSPSPETIRVVSRSKASRAAPGDRVHVVQAGESLWSIAADRLGERATVARIAREVNRLWELNDDRIASGNPDLLFAGTRLRL